MIEGVGFLIFILNDLLFYVATNAYEYLFVDYSCRILLLGLMLYYYRQSKFTLADFNIRKIGVKTLIVYTLPIVILSVLISELSDRYLYSGGFVKFYAIQNSFLYLFDLTVGLILVSLSEELLFRGLIYNRLNRHKILISSLLFALIHWGMGFSTVFAAFFIGVLFAYSVKKTDSILPALTAHYFVNLILFSNIL